MSNELLRHISKKLQDEIQILSDEAALGKAKDFGEYKYACGIIRGFMLANGILAETARRMEHDEDEG